MKKIYTFFGSVQSVLLLLVIIYACYIGISAIPIIVFHQSVGEGEYTPWNNFIFQLLLIIYIASIFAGLVYACIGGALYLLSLSSADKKSKENRRRKGKRFLLSGI